MAEQAPAAVPAIVPGWDGTAVIAVRLAQRCVPFTQLFRGVTQIFPPAKADENDTVMLFVVEVPLAPVGSVQV